jgi:cell division protein FtsB
MKYWDTEDSKKKGPKRPRRSYKGTIASSGSIKNSPFLRKFYEHHSVISEGLQKLVFFLILAALVYAFVIGDSGGIRLLMLRHDRDKMENKLSELKRNVLILEQEIDHLKNDPFYMEKLGRERYGYIYPGEKVIKLIPNVDKTNRLDR